MNETNGFHNGLKSLGFSIAESVLFYANSYHFDFSLVYLDSFLVCLGDVNSCPNETNQMTNSRLLLDSNACFSL